MTLFPVVIPLCCSCSFRTALAFGLWPSHYFDHGAIKPLLLPNLGRMVWVLSMHTTWGAENAVALLPFFQEEEQWVSVLPKAQKGQRLLLLLDFGVFQKKERGNLLYFSSWSVCQSTWTARCRGRISCWIFLQGFAEWGRGTAVLATLLHLRVCCSCF